MHHFLILLLATLHTGALADSAPSLQFDKSVRTDDDSSTTESNRGLARQVIAGGVVAGLGLTTALALGRYGSDAHLSKLISETQSAFKSSEHGLKPPKGVSPKAIAKITFSEMERSQIGLNSQRVPVHAGFIAGPEPSKLRVMTYNIALLSDPGSLTKNPANAVSQILETIQTTNPDLLVLQEIPGHRSQQLEELHSRMLALGYTHFHMAMNQRLNGRVGNVLYSKLPLARSKSYKLVLNPKLYRNVIAAVVMINNEPVLLLGTHLSHGQKSKVRAKELDRIPRVIAEEWRAMMEIKRVILAGDLNMELQPSETLAHGLLHQTPLLDPVVDGYSNWQHRLIDHVLVDENTLRDMTPVGFTVFAGGSDHKPFVMDLKVPGHPVNKGKG